MIRITCDCKKALPIDRFEDLQGDLKTIDPEALNKLKASITAHGFSFPIFVWRGKILDGHQRIKAVKELVAEGQEIEGGKLPVVEIKAKDEKEAAEKLLLINSRYAQIDQSGFDLFISDFSIDLESISDLLVIPEINFSFMKSDDDDDDDDDDDEMIKKDVFEYKIIIECVDEKEQVKFIKSIEELGIECRPLIL